MQNMKQGLESEKLLPRETGGETVAHKCISMHRDVLSFRGLHSSQ